jgi:hypothetical protein
MFVTFYMLSRVGVRINVSFLIKNVLVRYFDRHLNFGGTGGVSAFLQLSQLEPSTVSAAFVLSREILESGA